MAARPALQSWFPVGEEPLAPHNITQYAILRNNGVSVLSMPDGDINASREESASTGMYHQDTRYLSRFLLSFGGVKPSLLDARQVNGVLSAIYTNPTMGSIRSGAVIPAQSLVVRRRRLINDCLVESLTISNYSSDAVEFDLRVEFDMDFADIFEIRGFSATREPGPVTCSAEKDRTAFSSVGADGKTRQGSLCFSPVPTILRERDAEFAIRLAPRESRTLDVRVSVGEPHEECAVPTAISTVNEERTRRQAATTSFECDNHALNGALRRCLDDIDALRTRTGEMEYVAAGVPWFDTLFGRDSLITGMELLAWDSSILRLALEALAAHQADDDDPVHDATPGKIPHELRWGELAVSGEVPFGRYYGSIDATPLYVIAAWEYYCWTGDSQTVRGLWPALEAAVGWCERQISESELGCVSYSRVSVNGLENQGWKDSHDAIVWPDGSLVEGPISLIEVQGYVAAAFRAFGRLAEALGQDDGGAHERRASDFIEHIERLFSNPDLGYVLCLDGKGQPVPTLASNAGHMLWCRVARHDLASKVAANLLDRPMFSGWGVRTLGATVGRYNPLGYHVGSVWPHDNALFLAGLRAYDLNAEADTLATAMIEMALAFTDSRVPELFSGDARDLRLVPTPYPVASRPQAWSAASVPYVIASMLGLAPGRAGQLAVVNPRLPTNLQWVQLRNLHFSGGTVDLTFRRTAGQVAVEVESMTGAIEVVLTRDWGRRTS